MECAGDEFDLDNKKGWNECAGNNFELDWKGRNSSFEPQKMKLGSKNLILIYVFSIFFLW